MDLNDCGHALTYQETSINSTRIVMAGDQFHDGKMTSSLEALCGVDLPPGEGIQTRVPLVLQLRQAQEDEYAVIHVVKGNVLRGTTKQKERIALGQIGNEVREYSGITRVALDDQAAGW
jgi:Na+-transporting NADH:ubiquinone oxidoreductase subunit NqrA